MKSLRRQRSEKGSKGFEGGAGIRDIKDAGAVEEVRALRAVVTKMLLVLMLTLAIASGMLQSGEFLNAKAYAEESGGAPADSSDDGSSAAAIDVCAGDHIYLGNKNTAGFTGLPYWRVLDKDEDGYLLLMSEYLWTGADAEDFTKFNEIADESTPLEGYEEQGYKSRGSAWQGSLAQQWCINFENEVLGDISGIKIKEITKSDGEFTSPDKTENTENAYITFAATREILNDDRVFFLSAEEVVQYMPETSDREAYLHDGTSKGEIKDWWLRSPRLYTISECAGKVFAYGSRRGMIGRQVVTSLGAARPAVWVKIECEESDSTWTLVHSYGSKKYTWSSDNKTCTASAKCVNCGKAISEKVSTTSKVTKQATLSAEGQRTYTAKFSDGTFAAQTRKVKIAKLKLKIVTDRKYPKPAIKAPMAAKKAFTVKWTKLSASKQKTVQGIEIQYAADKAFKKQVVTRTVKKGASSYKISKLKSKGTYYVRMRTYKKSGAVKRVSVWSAVKKVKTK